MKNWQDFEVEPEIMVFDGCEKSYFVLGDSTYFCYVQHDNFGNSPTYGKIGVRDGRWRGCLKAIILNMNKKHYDEGVSIEKLTFKRWSKSRSSILVEATFKKK